MHTAPPLTGAPQTVPVTSSVESAGQDGGTGERGMRPDEGSDCKCVSSGMKPKGELLYGLKKVILGS